MRFEEILSEALKLSIEDRPALATTLLEGVEGSMPPPISMGDEEAIALAMRRDLEIESGKVVPISYEELMQTLRG